MVKIYTRNIVLYFTKATGGMHKYAEMIHQGYKQNGLSSNLMSYPSTRYETYILLLLSTFSIRSKLNSLFDQIYGVPGSIIHITDTPLYISAFLSKNISQKHKYILTVHDPDPHPEASFTGKIKYYVMKILNWHLYSLARKYKNVYIHIHSSSQLQYVKTSKRVVISRLPIDAELIKYTSEVSNTKVDELTFLFIGRIEYYKGVDIFIDSVRIFNMTNEVNAHFILAGRGASSYQYHFVDNLEVIDKYLSDDEFLDLIIKSNVIVLPYRQATQSLVLNMALGLNKPVIISNVGTLKEYVSDCKTGSVLKNLHPETLSEEYRKYVNYEYSLDDMTENTWVYKQKFSPKEVVAKIIKGLQL